MITNTDLLKRIDELITIASTEPWEERGPQAYAGTLQITTLLYGPDSHQLHAVKEVHARYMGYSWGADSKHRAITTELRGILRNYKTEIEQGLITSLRTQAQAEVLSDFIALAKQALGEGSKDVAAVLACASLEDCLKKFARAHDLDMDEKDMSETINALKSKGALKDAEGRIAQSHVTLRNKAFHAEWQKIGEPEIGSVIGFVENFILKHLT